MPKKLVAASPRKAALVHYEDRPLKPNEVKVKVLHAAPKHGSELADFRGESPHHSHYYDDQWKLFLPRTEGTTSETAGFQKINLGNQWVGEIIEAGSEVEHFSVGDRVCGYGGIRETHIVDVSNPDALFKMPDHMSWKNAVCLDPAIFALGGMGAGMFCMEGTGAFSHFSLRHAPDLTHEPPVFSAVCVKGKDGNRAKVLEGPIPRRKVFGQREKNLPGWGLYGKHFGLPRFADNRFHARFPFAVVELGDPDLPVDVSITGWSPFIPLEADDSSLPAAGLEYTFVNRTDEPIELVYSFHATQFMAAKEATNHRVLRSEVSMGFVLDQPEFEQEPWKKGAFSAVVDHPQARVNAAWFRGGWADALTMTWNDIVSGECVDKPPIEQGDPSPGASIYVPLTLQAHERQTIRLLLTWYVPDSNLTIGVPEEHARHLKSRYYKPWYAGRFADITEVTAYWLRDYDRLREETERFTNTLYGTTMPAEIVQAVTSNLTIFKSPTILRQTDGRLWSWEGCNDQEGSCHGTCTHVWNYAQALAHLFPDLERGIRVTEFEEGQNEQGHQNFRIPLPIAPSDHDFYAACDGQLGGIMKVCREWRISGDTAWLRSIWNKVRQSLHYCMETWDPDRLGVLIEPHHNTYDIEFWGPDGMCTSIYLGALKAASLMAQALGEPDNYDSIYRKGKKYMEERLFNGEYFEQHVQWEGLRTPPPDMDVDIWNVNYSPEAMDLLRREGPKYQYGKGCLSDGVLGAWMAQMCGIGDILDPEMVRSHLLSV